MSTCHFTANAAGVPDQRLPGQTLYLRGYAAALHRKLASEPSEPRYFITASGLGYRFQNDS